MKALLLQAGDTKNKKPLFPVEPGNMEFSYFPVQKRESKKKVCLNPDLKAFTFSSGSSPMQKDLREEMLKLKKGDLAVFYFNGLNQNEAAAKEKYIFSYFTVKKISELNSNSKKHTVTIQGYATKSFRLKYCIEIAPCKDGIYTFCKEMKDLFGISEPVSKNFFLIKEKKHINNLKEVLGMNDPMSEEDFEKMDVITHQHFYWILTRDKKLNEREKDYLSNVFASKSGRISDDTEGMWDLNFPHFERMNVYFELYYKVYN
ncbi:hypothetical protein BH10BAC5_BH10BAC5_22830 [soil metagenome]